MGDGAMCHECRRYHCVCGDEAAVRVSEPSAAQAYNAVASNPQPLLDERDKLRNALRDIRRRISGRQLPFCNDIRDVIKAALLPLLLCMLIGCDGLLPPLPTPTPTPSPIGDVDWVVVVEESADRTTDIAVLFADPFWRTIKSRWYDDDSPDAASYVQATEGQPRPTILLLDKSGRKLFAGPLPKTVPEIQTLIGGAK